MAASEPTSTTAKKAELAEKGPILWSELHLRALKWDPNKVDVAFLRRLSYRLHAISPGCECRYFYNQWREKNPPDYKNYFKWTVDLHNAVNKKLNKPTMTLAAAKKHWTGVESTV